MKKTILTLGLVSLCSGCANFSPLTKQKQLGISKNTTQWLTYDSSRRGTLIVTDSAGKVTTCAEPSPDTSFSFNNTFKGNASSGNTTVGVEAVIAANAIALAGRDNLVLLARETMFRLCEAASNGFITAPQYNVQFGNVLKQINTIADTVRAESKAAQVKSEAFIKALDDRKKSQ